MALGRPRFIHREDVSTPAPFSCDFPDDTSVEIPVSYDGSAFAGTLILFQTAHLTHDLLSGHVSHAFVNDPEQITALHGRLQHLHVNVSQLTPPSIATPSEGLHNKHIGYLILHSHINNVILALHRPYVTTSWTSRVAAVEAALDVLKFQKEIFEQTPFSQYKFYSLAFPTIDVAIFLAAIAIDRAQWSAHDADSILDGISQPIERLDRMSERNRLARLGEVTLRRLYKRIQGFNPRALPEVDNTAMMLAGSDLNAEASASGWTMPFPEQPFSGTFEPFFDSSFGSGNAPISVATDMALGEGDYQETVTNETLTNPPGWPT